MGMYGRHIAATQIISDTKGKVAKLLSVDDVEARLIKSEI